MGNTAPVPAFSKVKAGLPPAFRFSFPETPPTGGNHMLNKIMAAAAVSALALTSAMAQTTSPSPSPSTPSTPPAATAPSTSGSSASNTSAPNPAGKAQFITKQTQDQWLATKFKGTDVIGANDEKIGDVSDILFDKDKKVVAYIVGVGGFLGIGQKDVAIDPASFQMVPASATRSGGSSTGTNTGSTASTSNDHDNFKLRLSMTKDELKNAPAFEQYSARPATTSQAPANRPAGGSAPATAPAPKQ
jgi:sporulation protein YlmC with PRC-barrel domain